MSVQSSPEDQFYLDMNLVSLKTLATIFDTTKPIFWHFNTTECSQNSLMCIAEVTEISHRNVSVKKLNSAQCSVSYVQTTVDMIEFILDH